MGILLAKENANTSAFWPNHKVFWVHFDYMPYSKRRDFGYVFIFIFKRDSSLWDQSEVSTSKTGGFYHTDFIML